MNPLGRSALEVSALSLGTMNFGADIYGRGAAEEMLGRLLLDRASELCSPR